MGLGLMEILLVIAAGVASLVVVRSTGRRWVGLIPLVCLIAAVTSPADVVSMLLIAVPNVLVMALAVRAAGPRSGRKPTLPA